MVILIQFLGGYLHYFTTKVSLQKCKFRREKKIVRVDSKLVDSSSVSVLKAVDSSVEIEAM